MKLILYLLAAALANAQAVPIIASFSAPTGTPALVSSQLYVGMGGSGTSTAIDTTGAKLLIVARSCAPTCVANTISDSKGNTWTGLTLYYNTGSTTDGVQIFYVCNATTGTGHTFSTSTTGFDTLFIGAFSGVGTASGCFVSGTDNGAIASGGGVISLGPVTPQAANNVAILGAGSQTGISASVSLGTIFQSSTNASYMTGALAWYTTPSTSAISATVTTGTAFSSGAIAIFK